MPNTFVEDEAEISDSPKIVYGNGGFSLRNRCYHSGYGSMGFSVGRRELSSEAGAKDTKDEDDDDLEEGFSELEEGFSELEETPVGDEGEKLLDSDTELSDDSVSEESDIEEPHNELELPLSHDEDEILEVKKCIRRRVESELFKAIMAAPGHTIHTALDKWVEEGKELSRVEISLAMVNLRKRKMYGRALPVIGSNLFLFLFYTFQHFKFSILINKSNFCYLYLLMTDSSCLYVCLLLYTFW
jgi:hypothetical protein